MYYHIERACEAYDPRDCNDAKKGWQQLSSLPGRSSRSAFGVVALNDWQCLLLGGSASDGDGTRGILEYDVHMHTSDAVMIMRWLW